MRERERRWRVMLTIAGLLAVTGAVAAVPAGARATSANAYIVHNLVSDQAGVADRTDPNLVNAWGLTSLPASPWWVADNGTDVSTLYQADGTKVSLVVKVPNAPTEIGRA